MSLSKKKRKGSWRRAARRALAAAALVVVTFLGHTSLRGEELRGELPVRPRWETSREVQEALVPASEPSFDTALPAGGLIPLTELERVSRSIYW